jgi:hypothetical protein
MALPVLLLLPWQQLFRGMNDVMSVPSSGNSFVICKVLNFKNGIRCGRMSENSECIDQHGEFQFTGISPGSLPDHRTVVQAG